MSDPKRNPERVLRALAAYLAAFPEMRVGQAVANNLPVALGNDPFYVEDDDLATLLECSTPKPAPAPSTTRAPGGEPPPPCTLERCVRGDGLHPRDSETCAVLPEERGTGGRCPRCGLGMNNGGNLSQSGDGPEVHICAAPETPATGPVRISLCWYPDERGFNCVLPAGHRGDHEPAPGATRGAGGTEP